MTLTELLNQIRQKEAGFPAAQRLVAAFVVENYMQIPFLTINTMADTIGVSSNTIIKFCNQLGYNKFAEFKNEFSGYVHSEFTMYNKLSQSAGDSAIEDSFFAKELDETMNAVRYTLSEQTNQHNLPKLLELMDRARSIYITGGRSSASMAALLASMLRYLGYKVYEVDPDVGSYLDYLSMIDREDLVIAIAFPRYTAQVVTALKNMHQTGIPIALLTDTGLSPAYPYGDVVFQCSVNSGYYFPDLSGCLALINVICHAAAASRQTEASKHIHRLETSLLDQGIFYK